jgi:hypothetical protein
MEAIFSLELMKYIIQSPASVAPAVNRTKYPQFNRPAYRRNHLYAICFKHPNGFHSDHRFGV